MAVALGMPDSLLKDEEEKIGREKMKSIAFLACWDLETARSRSYPWLQAACPRK